MNDFYEEHHKGLSAVIELVDQLESDNPMQTVRLIKLKREVAKLLASIPKQNQVFDFDLDLELFFD